MNLVVSRTLSFQLNKSVCIGVGFDSATVEGVELATQDGNLCDIGPASTLNAIATILYLIVCILLCW